MEIVTNPKIDTNQKVSCTHCGDECIEDFSPSEGLHFCCVGCEKIYFLLKDNNLDQYYSLNETPGVTGKNKSNKNYEYLDDPEVVDQIIDFKNNDISRVHFTLPDIHCSSCLWLLENIHRLNSGINHSSVNFLEKKAYITFRHDQISLKELVSLLDKIGYEPELNFAKLSEDKSPAPNRSLLLKIGVAGFSFGNIMLLSFPEYLGFEKASIHFHIGILNILLALPVLLYSGASYLIGAWENLRARKLGIHVPLALGMITLFSRSFYEIASGTGEGYFDSFTGFILFLLIGKWFQNYTQRSISFDRNYKSYFPISVSKLIDGQWRTNSIDKIYPGDLIQVKNGEIIPCDGIVSKGEGNIDYSFVTGEAEPNPVIKGDQVFAGGKQQGALMEIQVLKEVSQSYLTQLWNEKVFKEQTENNATRFLNKVSTYFTITIIIIAGITFLYWFPIDKSTAFRSITAVLIVACPCALALSVPFIMGNATRILAKFNFYAKNVDALESILDVDHIVFDKTGTITQSATILASYHGQEITEEEKSYIASAAAQSTHPLSQAIARFYDGHLLVQPGNFEEITGRGISVDFKDIKVRLGSVGFILKQESVQEQQSVLVEINGKIKGHFEFEHPVRKDIDQTLKGLAKYRISLLSGDNERERSRMEELFPSNTKFNFNQNPSDKLKYINKLQNQGQHVMMIGDGLNDAGALMQSNIGIVITEDNNSFSPACDAVISGSAFEYFLSFIRYIGSLQKALYGALVIALLYNVIGLGFAVTGNLSPIVAAILMPTSSITIMIYGLIISRLLARKYLSIVPSTLNEKSAK